MQPTIPARPIVIAAVLVLATAAAAQKFAWPPSPNNPPTGSHAGLAARPTASPAGASVVGVEPVAPAAPGAAGRLDWRILENPNGPHMALIFDPVRQVFAVYHVDSASGQIMLKSIRNLSADLQLDQFNSSNPAPRDIQGMLNEAR